MSKFVILTLFFLKLVSIAYSDAEEDAIKKMNRVFYFELTGWENYDNKLWDGSCCFRTQKDTCDACPSGIYTDWTKSQAPPQIVRFQTLDANHSSRFSLFGFYYKVDSNEIKRIDISARQKMTLDLYDFWYGADMDVVGVYPLNGVWGIHFNVLLWASIEVYVPSASRFQQSFNIFISRVFWISRTFQSGGCCSDVGRGCSSSCKMSIEADVNNAIIKTFNPSGYEVTNSSYFIKMGAGTKSSEAFRDDVLVVVKIYKNNTNQLIDQVKFGPLNMMPGERKYVYEKTGEYNKVRLDVEFMYDCNGYVGKNCKYVCNYDPLLASCRNDNGKPYCLNGAVNVPICTQFSTDPCANNPCENNGTCLRFRNRTICSCLKGYSGEYCTINNCYSECYRGTCNENNVCTCTDNNYRGPWCDESPCTGVESSYCKTGTCVRVKDVATCRCPSYATGIDCSVPNCGTVCQTGTCNFNGQRTGASCVCVDGFTGASCELLAVTIQSFTNDAIPYAIAIVCILLLLSLKMIMMSIFAQSTINAILPGTASNMHKTSGSLDTI